LWFNLVRGKAGKFRLAIKLVAALQVQPTGPILST
jgi:hypothetical protein